MTRTLERAGAGAGGPRAGDGGRDPLRWPGAGVGADGAEVLSLVTGDAEAGAEGAGALSLVTGDAGAGGGTPGPPASVHASSTSRAVR
ncbi:MAG: hypothetical protein M0Z54_08295 [Thermaerobacter sp.]|nr:hypothetical protein [Thermaerobacter sp.]